MAPPAHSCCCSYLLHIPSSTWFRATISSSTYYCLSSSLSAPCWSFSSPICYWYVFYPPCSYCWGLPSPHSCSCFHLPSCWNHSKTPYCSCFQSSYCSWCFLIICLPSTTCFCTSFFSASASISTFHLLVLFYNLSRLSVNWQSCTKNKKYPARCKSVHNILAINVIHTAKYRKYMHVGFAINVIQTAKYRKYMHIEIASSWTHRNTFGVIEYPYAGFFYRIFYPLGGFGR